MAGQVDFLRFFPCSIHLDSNSLTETNKKRGPAFLGIKFIKNDIYSNLMMSCHWPMVSGLLVFSFVLLWASRGCKAASIFETSSAISFFRQNVRLFNCIFNCLVRQRLIGLTSCCRMLRDMSLRRSSLNSLISLNTVCLCLQNVVISQWFLRTAVHKQIFWSNAIS